MYTTPKKLADRMTEQIANGTCAPDEALLVTVWFRADADENWDLTAELRHGLSTYRAALDLVNDLREKPAGVVRLTAAPSVAYLV